MDELSTSGNEAQASEEKRDPSKKNFITAFFQLIRFYLVGGINTLLTTLLFYGVFFLTESHIISLIADYSFGIIFSFFANRYFTFKVKDNDHKFQFLKMIISYGILFVLNYFLLKLFSGYLELNTYLAQFFAIVIIVMISFFVQKFFVFSKKLNKKSYSDEL